MMLACPQGKVGLGLMSAAFSPVDDAKVRASGCCRNTLFVVYWFRTSFSVRLSDVGQDGQPPKEPGFLRRLYVGRRFTDLGA